MEYAAIGGDTASNFGFDRITITRVRAECRTVQSRPDTHCSTDFEFFLKDYFKCF